MGFGLGCGGGCGGCGGSSCDSGYGSACGGSGCGGSGYDNNFDDGTIYRNDGAGTYDSGVSPETNGELTPGPVPAPMPAEQPTPAQQTSRERMQMGQRSLHYYSGTRATSSRPVYSSQPPISRSYDMPTVVGSHPQGNPSSARVARMPANTVPPPQDLRVRVRDEMTSGNDAIRRMSYEQSSKPRRNKSTDVQFMDEK
ncbi:MAG TPA: hypothetical protein VIY86_03345 [Pirellulaceae bacterium]